MKKIYFILFACIICMHESKGQTATMNPNSARRLDQLTVTITGNGYTFSPGSNTLQFFRNGSPTTHIKVNELLPDGPNLLRANLFVQSSATIGNYSYSVKNSFQNGTATNTNNFIVRPDTGKPRLVSMMPNVSEPGEILRVLITGENTHFLQASQTNMLRFFKNGSSTNDVYGDPDKILSNNAMTAIVYISPQAAFGKYNLELINPYETVELPDALTVAVTNNKPGIVSLSPPVGGLGETLSVTILGTRTKFTSGSPTVAFFRQGSPTTGMQINNYTKINDSNLVVNLTIQPWVERGFYYVVYGNGIGDVYDKSNAFEVTWPVGLRQEQAKQASLKVYPNPAKSSVKISTEVDAIESVEVFDLNGRLVQNDIPEKPAKELEVTFNEMLLPQQLYLLRIKTWQGYYFKKLAVE
jgi:hypothetical protein